MIEIPFNDKLIERNEKLYGCNDCSHCIICNKPVDTDAKRTLWVRIVHGGCYIGTEAEGEAEPAADLGYYPIGPDCARRHPELAQYIDRREWGVSVGLYGVK